MEKKHAEIKITETDTGFRIEVEGKRLNELGSCCCIPVALAGSGKEECCPPPKSKD